MIHGIAALASDLVKDVKGLSDLDVSKQCGFYNLLAAEWSTGVAWVSLSCVSVLYRCEKFLDVFYGVCPNNLF